MKLVPLGVTSEIVVIIEDENAAPVSSRFPVEMRRSQPADSTPDDNKVVFLAGVGWRTSSLPVIMVAYGMRNFVDAVMVSSQSGKHRWIVVGYHLRIRQIRRCRREPARNCQRRG